MRSLLVTLLALAIFHAPLLILGAEPPAGPTDEQGQQLDGQAVEPGQRGGPSSYPGGSSPSGGFNPFSSFQMPGPNNIMQRIPGLNQLPNPFGPQQGSRNGGGPGYPPQLGGHESPNPHDGQGPQLDGRPIQDPSQQGGRPSFPGGSPPSGYNPLSGFQMPGPNDIMQGLPSGLNQFPNPFAPQQGSRHGGAPGYPPQFGGHEQPYPHGNGLPNLPQGFPGMGGQPPFGIPQQLSGAFQPLQQQFQGLPHRLSNAIPSMQNGFQNMLPPGVQNMIPQNFRGPQNGPFNPQGNNLPFLDKFPVNPNEFLQNPVGSLAYIPQQMMGGLGNVANQLGGIVKDPRLRPPMYNQDQQMPSDNQPLTIGDFKKPGVVKRVMGYLSRVFDYFKFMGTQFPVYTWNVMKQMFGAFQ